MIRKKSSFLTFCFSFMPGAGQMYMGFMKRGLSLMSGFFLLICFAVWLQLSPLIFASVVIWFYAFFDTFNLRSMPDDEFYALEDDYLLDPEIGKSGAKFIQGKFRIFFAVALILIGFVILWNNICDLFYNILPYQLVNVLRSFGQNFPPLLLGLGIIALGIILILGKKKELDAMDQQDRLEDKGGDR
jgi:hypothetical protein